MHTTAQYQETMKSSNTFKRHDSQRGYFAFELFKQMQKDESIYLVMGDLGYKVFDFHRMHFPDRCINTGAAETAMMGIAVGLALEGRIPVVYSITNFLLYRPFEVIRNYIDYEKIPVKMVAAGRDRDYAHDGISHWSEDAKDVLKIFKNIKTYFPEEKEEMSEDLLEEILYNNKPSFLSLRR